MASLVLIVDDHFDNRAIYKTLLTHLGYDVAEAVDGDEAVKMAKERQPQVILMDMSLPGRDGWSATRAIKEDAGTAHIPVIALTAHVSEEYRTKAREAGCDAYIAKPVLPQVVAQTIRQFAKP